VLCLTFVIVCLHLDKEGKYQLVIKCKCGYELSYKAISLVHMTSGLPHHGRGDEVGNNNWQNVHKLYLSLASFVSIRGNA
jgi:hypothetical protein